MARLIEEASPELLAQLITTIDDRIEVRGLGFVAAYLTPTVAGHGMALALPEQISRYWRPRRCLSPRHR